MSASVATGLAITNPLVKYRALVATKAISPDSGQYRLAVHLQKLYDKLKDYEPQQEYSQRLDQISRTVANQEALSEESSHETSPPRPRSRWRSLLVARERRDTLALTRRLTNHESAMQMTSPKGLLLHGEVGTGKSMLIDLFADCLPTRKKRRWHFNTFMLETFAKLEALRRERSTGPHIAGYSEDDHSLLWLAKDMIHSSPILFLDEFQLPDRVASKILTSLMTSFFHLGGVLIATSNRMPEELAKASGIEFAPPPGRFASLGWQLGLRRTSGDRSEGLFGGGQSEFAKFLDVLKARCEVWEMDGKKDYRRQANRTQAVPPTETADSDWELDGHDDLQRVADRLEVGLEQVEPIIDSETTSPTDAPLRYLTPQSTTSSSLEDSIIAATDVHSGGLGIRWEPSVLRVYGRIIPVPRTLGGVTLWTFDELCKSNLGPADYTSLASLYHTVVIDQVPIMTWLMKNEARRFITLLDALYECRCKLLIRAQAGPDHIFFPEKQSTSGEDNEDAVYSETLSEVYQDVTNPFRPNILTQNPNYAEPDPEPDYTHARLAGLLNADALEDDPPNKPRRNPFGRSFGRTDSELERKPIDPDESRYTRPNFSRTGAFTGEDERFAYKRAQSRLWEMCSEQWWARNEPGWHRPLPLEVRRWERSADEPSPGFERKDSGISFRGDAAMGDAVPDSSRDERSFKHNASPFRTSDEPPPKFNWTHFWSTTKWGKRAGAWGQGVDGLKGRGNEKG